MKPRLLCLCFFPAFVPPVSGGETRLLNLYRAASAHFSITLLTSTDFGARYEEHLHAPDFRECRFPKDELWRRAYATLEQSGVDGELSGLAFSLAVSDPTCTLRTVARRLAREADFVVHEFPYSEPIFSDGLAAGKEIYNSHNFEASLFQAVVSGPGFEAIALKLMRLEGNLVRRALRTFATSDADLTKFRLFYGAAPGSLALCPNGFDERDLEPAWQARQSGPIKNARPKLLFFGSSHRPNVEAATAILAIAADLPHYDFVLAGGVCGPIVGVARPRNVILVGAFDQGQKRRLLAEADLFINPVALGSGTSLKMLDALAAGLPIVSTPEGARGLGLVADRHAVLTDRDHFPAAIAALMDSAERRLSLSGSGRAHVAETFTWPSIAARFAETLAQAPLPIATRRLVLALNDYPVLDTNWGGKVRIRNLLANLDSDVVIVSFGDAFDVTVLGLDAIHVTVPKSVEHRMFEHTVNDGEPLSVDDCVAALFALSNRILTSVVAEVAKRAGAVVFEHCYLGPLIEIVDAVRDRIPVVYSAHNVEARHRVEMLAAHKAGAAIGAMVAALESATIERADLIVCCTEADARHFRERQRPTIVVPNGSDIRREGSDGPANRRGALSGPRVGFIGSGHEPNAEAARFILDTMVPAFPAVRFEFVGAVCGSLVGDLPDNVTLHGVVGEVDKADILAAWTLALNPIVSGGGSSLKLPDYMAHGLATLNTAVGARGYAVAERGAGLVVKRAAFVERLQELLDDAPAVSQMQRNARLYARDALGWSALAGPYRAALDGLAQGAAAVPGRSLLVVTYRYTEPALGGAEEYLAAILRHLRHRFERIDLVATDVGGITNLHHFGSHVTREGGESARLGELFDRAHFFAPETQAAPAILAACRRLERTWGRDAFDLYIRFADDLSCAGGGLHLFSGFYDADIRDGVVRRWSGPDFSILVPNDTVVLRVKGLAHIRKSVAVTLISVTDAMVPVVIAEHGQSLDGRFTLDLSLACPPDGGPVIVYFQVDEDVIDGDHRPFGIQVEHVGVLRKPAGSGDMTGLVETVLDLAQDKDRLLRATQFERWVASLHELGLNNAPETETDFAAVRGPHSAAMQDWLKRNGSQYDTVLVQGVPFDVVPSTVATLDSLATRPRIVTLPHFHGDDRFYHWRRYDEAFRKADATLLFSPAIAAGLGAGPYRIVPGGGVGGTETGDPSAIGRFRQRHRGEAPFFLVLGRKTGSKNYEQIVAAHAVLRASGVDVDLVMIGPDEDGRLVDRPGVVYLGRQPRDVVRGALAECRALVSMSVSESFGIVLCEAWAFGKPVIAARACYSFREMMDDAVLGRLVDGIEDLVAAMRATLATDDDPDAKARRIRIALDRYSWPAVAEAVARQL